MLNKTKKVKSNTFKDYFTMLFKAKLPYKLLLITLAISFIKAQLALIFADKLGSTIREYADIKEAITPLLILFIIGIGSVIVAVVKTYVESIATAQVERNMQQYALEKVYYLKMDSIEEDDPRQLVTRLTDDTSKSGNFIIDLTVNELPRLYYIIAATFAVIELKLPVLTITLLLVIPVIFLGAFISGKVTFKNREKVQNKIASLTALLAEKLDNMGTIKSYLQEEQEIVKGNDVIMQLDKAKKQGAYVDQLNAFIKNMMWFLPLLLIIIPPAILMFNKQLTQGEFFAYIMLATTFRTYTAEHLTTWIYLKEAQGATARLTSILACENEKDVQTTSNITSGNLKFEDVSFNYQDNEVLHHVSFNISKGQKTAIVGTSGSGKSTILNLIEKFNKPTSGTIYLNDVDIATLDYQNYRKLFAYLPQNAPVFDTSVKEMLTYAVSESITDEKLIDILEKVDLWKDLKDNGGLDYQLGFNGSKLSGGQKQRLNIAALFLTNNEYVLIDEATSAIDQQSKTQLSSLIDEKFKGKTQIIVTHDLATMENADKIIVLHNGDFIAEGTHQQLLESCPSYVELLKKGA